MLWDADDAEGRTALRRASLSPLQAVPAGFGEAFDTGFDQALAEEQSISRARMEERAWAGIVDDAMEKTGQTVANPAAAMMWNTPLADRVAKAVTGDDWSGSAAALYEKAKGSTRARLTALREAGFDVSPPTDQDIQDRVQAEADRARDALALVQAGGGFQGIAGSMAGNFAGVMADPPNLLTLPIGAARGVGVLRSMLTEAGVNMAVETDNQIEVSRFKRELGRDYGAADAAEAVGMAGAGAAALTGAFHGAAALLRRWRGAKAENPRLGELPEAAAAETLAARTAMQAETNPYSPGIEGENSHAVALDAAEEALNGEREALRAALRSVEENPVGDPFHPLVELTAADMEKVIVARGGFKNINEMEVTRSGWGLVKVIWGHGSKSKKQAELRVGETDVLALPDILRTRRPVDDPDHPTGRTWIVEREGPSGVRRIAYGTNLVKDRTDQHVVTIHVVDPKDQKWGLGVSEPVSGPRPEAGFAAPPSDTAARGSQSTTRRQAGQPAASGARVTDSMPGNRPEADVRNAGDGSTSINVARAGGNFNQPDFRPLPGLLRAPGDGKKPQSLIRFFKSKGGLRDEAGELAAMDLRRAAPGLVSRRGLSPDYAREAAVEAGFFRADATVGDVTEAIRREIGGSPVYRPEDTDLAVRWDEYQQWTKDVSDYLGGTDAVRGMSDADLIAAMDIARARRAWTRAAGEDMPIGEAEAAALASRAKAEGRTLDAVAEEVAETRAMMLEAAAAREDLDIPFGDEAVKRVEESGLDADGRWRSATDDTDPDMEMPFSWDEGDEVYRRAEDWFALADEWDRAAAEATACAAGGMAA